MIAFRGVMLLCITGILILLAHRAPATYTLVEPLALPIHSEVLAGIVFSFDITPSAPDGETEARLNLHSADSIHALNLLLQFEPNGLLSGNASDFAANPAFFPATTLGDHPLNSARDAGPGRIRIIGLAPTATTGRVEIGQLRLHIKPDAPIGATQTVTLSGEINQVGSGVTKIEPIVATVQVIEMNHRLYLPSVQR